MAKMTKKGGIGTINPNYDDDEKYDKKEASRSRIGPLIVYPQHLHPPCRVHSSRPGCNINMMMMIIIMIIMILQDMDKYDDLGRTIY